MTEVNKHGKTREEVLAEMFEREAQERAHAIRVQRKREARERALEARVQEILAEDRGSRVIENALELAAPPTEVAR